MLDVVVEEDEVVVLDVGWGPVGLPPQFATHNAPPNSQARYRGQSWSVVKTDSPEILSQAQL